MDQVQPRRRFFLGGLTTPVLARVASQTPTRMTLQQELPFLQLDTDLMDEDGRAGSLTGVSVTLRDGTPCLVLDVSYADGRERDATVPFETACEGGSVAARLMDSTRTRRRRDETVPFGIVRAEADIDPPRVITDSLETLAAAAGSGAVRASSPAPAMAPTPSGFALRPIPFWMRFMNWFSQFFAP